MAEAARHQQANEPAAGREPFRGLINALTGTLMFFGEMAVLSLRSASTLLREGVYLGDLVKQMAVVGADSLWIVLIITTATGAVFAFYTAMLATSIGFTQFVGGTLAYGFLNELGPVLGGVAFAARAGAAMAASPIRYLVLPRVLASLIMLPLLTVIADFAGLVGGYLFAERSGVSSALFLDSVYKFAQSVDMTRGLIKSVVFGFMVGLISCQQGLRTSGGASGVGRATTSSVMLGVMMIFITDFFLAQILTGQIQRR